MSFALMISFFSGCGLVNFDRRFSVKTPRSIRPLISFFYCLLEVVDVILVVLHHDCEESLGGIYVLKAQRYASIDANLYR